MHLCAYTRPLALVPTYTHPRIHRSIFTRWFKYDRDYLCVNKSQFVPVIFEPPCNTYCFSTAKMIRERASMLRYTYIAAVPIYTYFLNQRITVVQIPSCVDSLHYGVLTLDEVSNRFHTLQVCCNGDSLRAAKSRWQATSTVLNSRSRYPGKRVSR
jgi:hypothetical protein